MIAFILFEVLFFGVLLAADLLSKHFLMPYLEQGGDVVLIKKVITLTPTYNDGAGFSFLSGKTGALIAITTVGLVIISAVLVYAHVKMEQKDKRTRFLQSVLVMMLSGGVGNLIDRIAYGSVRDFIDYTVIYTLFKRNFAICNVADIWLTVGMVLLVVYVIFMWKTEDKPVVQDETNVATALRMMEKREGSVSSQETPAVAEDGAEQQENGAGEVVETDEPLTIGVDEQPDARQTPPSDEEN